MGEENCTPQIDEGPVFYLFHGLLPASETVQN